jgi:hypothetical protein
LLDGPKTVLERYSRWGSWEDEVLTCVSDPEACQKLIERRQAEVDGDQEDGDLVRECFVSALRQASHDPDTEVVFISSKEAADIVNEATGEKRPTNKATAFLGTLPIPELRKSKREGARGFRWTGSKADAHAVAIPLRSAIECFNAGREA